MQFGLNKGEQSSMSCDLLCHLCVKYASDNHIEEFLFYYFYFESLLPFQRLLQWIAPLQQQTDGLGNPTQVARHTSG